MATRRVYERELDELKQKLIKMCRLTESMISSGVKAVALLDKELAAEVTAKDASVNALEREIEKICLSLLLKQQPVAKDFREISSALKMITDIERIGDQAADICNIVINFPEGGLFKKLDLIPRMGELAGVMVHSSVESFIKDDLVLAKEIMSKDDEMDTLFKDVQRDIAARLKTDPSSTDQGVMVLMIAKYYERIGDHAVNICEWVHFFETGEHVREQKTK